MDTGLILHASDFYSAEAPRFYATALTEANSDLDNIGVEVVIGENDYVDEFVRLTDGLFRLHPVFTIMSNMPVETLNVINHYVQTMNAHRVMVLVSDEDAAQNLRWLGAKVDTDITLIVCHSSYTELRGVRKDLRARTIMPGSNGMVECIKNREIPVAFSIGADRAFIESFIKTAKEGQAAEIYFWSWLAAHKNGYLDLILNKPSEPEPEKGVPLVYHGTVIDPAYVRVSPSRGARVVKTLSVGEEIEFRFFFKREDITFGQTADGHFVAVQDGNHTIISIRET